jgi:Mrp family chromosome partitioning ATPase
MAAIHFLQQGKGNKGKSMIAFLLARAFRQRGRGVRRQAGQ